MSATQIVFGFLLSFVGFSAIALLISREVDRLKCILLRVGAIKSGRRSPAKQGPVITIILFGYLSWCVMFVVIGLNDNVVVYTPRQDRAQALNFIADKLDKDATDGAEIVFSGYAHNLTPLLDKLEKISSNRKTTIRLLLNRDCAEQDLETVKNELQKILLAARKTDSEIRIRFTDRQRTDDVPRMFVLVNSRTNEDDSFTMSVVLDEEYSTLLIHGYEDSIRSRHIFDRYWRLSSNPMRL